MLHAAFALLLLLTLPATQASARPSARALALLEGHPTFSSRHVTDDGYTRGAGCRRQHLRLKGKDPVNGGPSEINARIYLPASERLTPRTRTVLLLPPLTGVNPLDKFYSNLLCGNNIRAVLVYGWSHLNEATLDMKMYDNEMLRTVVAVRRLLDYVDPLQMGSVGILGTSLGAIKAGMMLGVDPRLSTGVLITGGTDLAGILAHSTEKGNAFTRSQRMRRMKMRSVKTYESALRANILLEPHHFIGMSGRKKVLAFVATEDTVVPTKNQVYLERGFGAELQVVTGGHIKAIMKVAARHHDRVIEFFLRNL